MISFQKFKMPLNEVKVVELLIGMDKQSPEYDFINNLYCNFCVVVFFWVVCGSVVMMMKKKTPMFSSYIG